MKSKSLLPLLLYCLSVICAFGQSYPVTIPAGSAQKYQEFSDNFLTLSPGGTDLANSPVGMMLSPGANIYTWTPSTGTYSVYSKVNSKGVIKWAPSDPAATPGGAFICIDPNGSGFTATLTQGLPNSVSPIAGFSPTTTWYFLGSQIFTSAGATYNYQNITGYPNPGVGVTGVSLYRPRTLPLGYPPGFASDPVDNPGDWNEYWWNGTTWNPSAPSINAGEAVWIGPSTCAIEGSVVDNSGNPLPNWQVSLTSGQSVFTDANGNYRFPVPSTGGEYTVLVTPHCGWTVSGPTNYSVTCPGPTIVRTFVAKPEAGNNNVRDLAVTVIYVPDPGYPAYPCSFDYGSYYVYYENKCGPTVPPPAVTLKVTLSTHVQYGAIASPGSPGWSQISGPPAAGGGGTGPTLNFTLVGLAAGSVGVIKIPVQVMSIPLNTVLSTTATIKPLNAGVRSADNTFTSNIKAKCAFDPNSKVVEPEGCGPTGLINNQPLTYTIQFQNDGTAPAFQVVVTDQLDPSLDPSTLTLLSASSENYVFNLSGNQMTWTFPNIDLPDTNDNLAGSYGFVSYQVQPLAGLADGTVITNQASIVFDENPPVLTDITTNTITSATMPSASFTVTPLVGSADATNDFTYTGGTAGATYYWDFGTDAIPSTSTNMSPTNVVFLDDGLTTVNLQVSAGGCTSTAASYLLNVGVPFLNITSSGSNQFVLSWDGDGYSLQQTSILTNPVPWQPFSQPLTQVGATYFTPPITISNTTTFFRLTD